MSRRRDATLRSITTSVSKRNIVETDVACHSLLQTASSVTCFTALTRTVKMTTNEHGTIADDITLPTPTTHTPSDPTMQLKLTLMGALKKKTPPENRLELADGSNIADILSVLDIAPAAVQIVMVNGKPRSDRTAALADGDELTFVAPVGGG